MAVTYWHWYGPPSGQNSVEHVVAYTHPVVDALESHARRIGIQADVLLAARSDVRTGQAQIKVYPRKSQGGYPYLDAYVVLEDGNGGAAAESIEMGADREYVNKKTGKVTRYTIPGKYVLHDAAGLPR
jgi:hypothetical protein